MGGSEVTGGCALEGDFETPPSLLLSFLSGSHENDFLHHVPATMMLSLTVGPPKVAKKHRLSSLKP